MELIKYPDGSSYVTIDGSDLRYKDFTFRINTYEDLWHLNQIVDAYKSEGVRPTVTIPNLLDAQADRRFEDKQSSGLKLVCNFLNNLEASFRIFHPHNPEVVEALIDDVVITDNIDFIRQAILDARITEDSIIMTPDAGMFKYMGPIVDRLGWGGDFLTASKVRKAGTVGRQTVPMEDFGGRDILLIDDLLIYGGTMKGLSKILRERNCGRLSLAVSHITVKDLKDQPITEYFDTVFTTNSKYSSYKTTLKDEEDGSYIGQPENLKVIKMFRNAI